MARPTIITKQSYEEAVEHLKTELGIDVEKIFDEIDLEALLAERMNELERALCKLKQGDRIRINYLIEEEPIKGEYVSHDPKAKTLTLRVSRSDISGAKKDKKTIKYTTQFPGTGPTSEAFNRPIAPPAVPNLVMLEQALPEGSKPIYCTMTKEELEAEEKEDPLEKDPFTFFLEKKKFFAEKISKLEQALEGLKQGDTVQIKGYPIIQRAPKSRTSVGEYISHDAEAKTLAIKEHKSLFGRKKEEERTIQYRVDEAPKLQKLELITPEGKKVLYD